MPLPLLLIGAAAVTVIGAAATAVVVATSNDGKPSDEESSRNQQDALRRARREEAERQMRVRRESIRRDAEVELHRIAGRHESSGRKAASRITFQMLEKSTAVLDTVSDFDAALNLLMPMRVSTQLVSRHPEIREIRALSEEIRILDELSSAVSVFDAKKSFSPEVREMIRRLERKLSSLGSKGDGSSGQISQSIDSLMRLASVKLQSPVRIVVCGLLCAGKSSLLNALTNRLSPEFFTSGGGRTTRDCEALVVQLADGCCRFVDTPGVDAEDRDDETAAKEVGVADHLLFVHTLATGELHKKEILFLEESVAPNATLGDTMRGLTMVLTHRESYDDVAERLTTSILTEVEKITGSRVPCFRTSAIVYEKGMTEDKQKLRELSGIETLRHHCSEIARNKEKITTARIMRVELLVRQLRQDVESVTTDRKRRREFLMGERKRREAEVKEDFRRFLEGVAERMKML